MAERKMGMPQFEVILTSVSPVFYTKRPAYNQIYKTCAKARK